ncbi:hypothetical protein DFH09DRAFT_1097525 [Mycena vulgaris]|nr:hypothetical protein DFH09DRAFT_1097525 [Mycena vulgaris]
MPRPAINHATALDQLINLRPNLAWRDARGRAPSLEPKPLISLSLHCSGYYPDRNRGSRVPTDPGTSIVKRTPGNIYVCNELNWMAWGSTPCTVISAVNTCLTLDASWAYEIGSIGPDAGATCYGYPSVPFPLYFLCVPSILTSDYGNTDCTGTDWSFTYPGDATGGWATSSHWENEAVLMTKTRAGTCYYPGGENGACGTTLQNSEMIVALSFADYASGATVGGTSSWQQQRPSHSQDVCAGYVGDSINLSSGAMSLLDPNYRSRWKDSSDLVLGLGSVSPA